AAHPGGLCPRRPAPALPLAVRPSLLDGPPPAGGGTLRRGAGRALGLPGCAAPAVLFPPRADGVPRHSRLADRPRAPHLGRRPGASIGLARGVELGDRRPLPAVPPGALRR